MAMPQIKIKRIRIKPPKKIKFPKIRVKKIG